MFMLNKISESESESESIQLIMYKFKNALFYQVFTI